MDEAGSSHSWIERELAGSAFRDERLAKRLHKLVERLDGAMGETIPLACADWANTKAAYRFLSNEAVSEAEILAGHFHATAARIQATDGVILIVQDTTDFSFKRNVGAQERIGSLTYVPTRRGFDAGDQPRRVCGLLMHASLALTTEGLPLGLTAIKFWSRAKFKSLNRLKHRVNHARIPIEAKESMRWLINMEQTLAMIDDPRRCVHIGDRENDIYEFFCRVVELGSNFVVRTCVDRLAGAGDGTIAAEMAEVAVKGLHRVEVRAADGRIDEADLELRYKRIQVLPPIGKQKRYPPLMLTVIHAEEQSAPVHRKPILWKLITNLEVNTPEQAIEKLDWYAMRWKIEVFHKILKSGCRVEEARLRTADRLANLVAVYCLLAWRIFWMTMLNRAAPDAAPELVLTPEECTILDKRVPDRQGAARAEGAVAKYLFKIARLGGYLARTHDPPPGNIVMWRGWRRLMDITDGYNLALGRCG